MRVLDLGGMSGLRSQALYHALCYSVSAGAPPTLAILYPRDCYVCVGFHRDPAQEVDQSYCSRRGLPVYRRRVGGGPVYLDPRQVFFQLIIPERSARMSVARAYAHFLRPAAEAYRTLGVPAELCGVNDLAVDGRKLSGTGMARIADAVVIVGNVILDFDYATMASVLKLPDSFSHVWVEGSMRRWVTSVHAETRRRPSYDEVAQALKAAFERGLGEKLEAGDLTQHELDLVERMEQRMQSLEWFNQDGYVRPARGKGPAVRRVKIRAGRYDGIFDCKLSGRRVRTYLSADAGVVEAVRIRPLDDDSGAERAALDRLETILPGKRGTVGDFEEAIESAFRSTGHRARGGEGSTYARLASVAAQPDD